MRQHYNNGECIFEKNSASSWTQLLQLPVSGNLARSRPWDPGTDPAPTGGQVPVAGPECPTPKCHHSPTTPRITTAPDTITTECIQTRLTTLTTHTITEGDNLLHRRRIVRPRSVGAVSSTSAPQCHTSLKTGCKASKNRSKNSTRKTGLWEPRESTPGSVSGATDSSWKTWTRTGRRWRDSSRWSRSTTAPRSATS